MYCLDTDTAIEYLRNNLIISNKVNSLSTQICITPITVLELFYGAYRSSQVDRRVKEVKDLLEMFKVLEITTPICEEFGRLKAMLMEKGEILDSFDLTIASFCKVNDCVLVTNNVKHFSRITGLKIESWG